jgi:outer membrane protein insertion porin family
MGNRLRDNIFSVFNILLAVGLSLMVGCNSTKHVPNGQYLLRNNKVTLTADKPIANKGEMKDNLGKDIIQKPNSYSFGFIPFKLALYNLRYNKLHNRPDSLLPKSKERPVLMDTASMQRSVENMRNYLYYQGYFYAKIKDTFRIHRKKAYVTYYVDAGKNYTIDKINYNIEDTAIATIVKANAGESGLQKGKVFTYSMLEDERGRVTSLVRNHGYYRFTQENVNFMNGLDTVDKAIFKDVESPIENAVQFISAPKKSKNTIDITINIQRSDDSLAYTRYTISSITVYPDYKNAGDLNDTTLIEKTISKTDFKYHDYYVHDKVLYEHIYLLPGDLYSEQGFNKTYTKLNELGIFQYIRVQPRESRKDKGVLSYDVLLNRTKRFELSPNVESSSGSTYALGSSAGISFRDRNFLHGANLLSISVNGGVELSYNDNKGKDFFDHFDLLTKYYGINTSLDFPKFIAPVPSSLFENSNLPHTIIGVGYNVMDRVNYFTLINTSANYTYSWHQSQNNTWTFSPAFVNIIRVPKESDSFRTLLSTNEYLANSYKQNFIEGENISFTYDDIISKHAQNYSYLKLSFEEAGGLLGGINQLGVALNSIYKIDYAQYTSLFATLYLLSVFPVV